MNEQDRDDADLVAYVTSEADEATRLRLEQRLATDPELARRLAELTSLELVADAVRQASTPAGHRRRSRRALSLALAAAAIAVAWLGLSLWLRPVVVPCEFRLVATTVADDADAYARDLGWNDALGRSLVRRRGQSQSAAPLTVAEFLAAITPLEAARSTVAFATAAAPTRGDFVTLRLRTDVACSLVVLRLDSVGRWERVYPARKPTFGEFVNRFEPGAVHIVPRPLALPNAVDGVSLHPGFDVPSDLAIRRAWFVVGVHPQALAPAALAAIDAELGPADTTFAAAGAAELDTLASRATARLVEQLQSRGFQCQGPFVAEAP